MSTVTTQEATIHTAAIEIKAIKVNGKALTLAVYRQIPEREWYSALRIVGDEVAFTATPMEEVWGRINECPHRPRCGSHVVHAASVRGERLYLETYDQSAFLDDVECLFDRTSSLRPGSPPLRGYDEWEFMNREAAAAYERRLEEYKERKARMVERESNIYSHATWASQVRIDAVLAKPQLFIAV